jgi:hypothetical protein
MKRAQAAFTRRSLLGGAGRIAMAAILPLSPVGAALAFCEQSPSAGPVMLRLSTYMSEARDRPLPNEVVEQTKLHILDTLGSMISGVALPPAQIALKFAGSNAGDRTATVVGSHLLCGAIEAATANGMLAHADETDDSHAPSHSHPGCAVVAAAFAAGEQFRIGGEHFLRAVALGYDIGPRVTMTLGGLRFQVETHHDAHSIANTFGASAAAACTASLNAQQMRWVLDLAAQQGQGSPLGSAIPSTSKRLSYLAVCLHAMESWRHYLFKREQPVWTMSSPARITFSWRSHPRRTRRLSSTSWACVTK